MTPEDQDVEHSLYPVWHYTVNPYADSPDQRSWCGLSILRLTPKSLAWDDCAVCRNLMREARQTRG